MATFERFPWSRLAVVVSRPVRRILFRTSRCRWRPSISAGGCPPAPAAYPGVSAGGPALPLSGLAPGGVYRAARVTPGAGALLPHRFTLTCAPVEPAAIGGLFSVALSCGSPRLGVTQHRALWSPDVPRTGRPITSAVRGRLADSPPPPSSHAAPGPRFPGSVVAQTAPGPNTFRIRSVKGRMGVPVGIGSIAAMCSEGFGGSIEQADGVATLVLHGEADHRVARRLRRPRHRGPRHGRARDRRRRPTAPLPGVRVPPRPAARALGGRSRGSHARRARRDGDRPAGPRDRRCGRPAARRPRSTVVAGVGGTHPG